MKSGEPQKLDKATAYNTGWIIEKQSYINPGRLPQIHARPVCRSCQADLLYEGEFKLHCSNVNCKKVDKTIELPQRRSEITANVVRMWEGKQRQKEGGNWLNLDQELIKIASDEDEDEKHWLKAKLLNTSRGKTIMVLAGEKGSKQKTQFFIKDELNEVGYDTLGDNDVDPAEIYIMFEAVFKDGTEFRKGKRNRP